MRTYRFLLALGIALLSGCEQPEPKNVSSESAAQPAHKAKPAVPDELDEAGATEALIKAGTPRRAREAYLQDPACPKATLRGVFRFAGLGKASSVPPDQPAELAIENPEAGEVSYYKNAAPAKRAQAMTYNGVTIPLNAVVMLRGVTAGRQPPLNRPVFNVKNGLPDAPILFCAVGERVYASTWDAHPCHLRLSDESGTSLGDGKIRAYSNTGQDPATGSGARLSIPESFLSAPVPHQGIFRLSCLRHPWQSSYIVATDNPYATVGYRGSFQLDEVPAGRIRLEVWHPEFEPLERFIEIDIAADEVKELKILFKPPAYLK